MPDHHQRLAARLRNQHLDRPATTGVEALVSWMGAVQAQDYAGAAWGVGQRIRNATITDVHRALDSGAIIRTHAMRPTWHFVAPADLVWLQQLTGPRVHAFNGPYYRRNELDPALLSRATARMEHMLRDGRHLTRAELAAGLTRAGIKAEGLRLALIVMYAELEAVICSGPRRGKQFTYALVSERVPRAPALTRDEALDALVRRYFTSHGPATLRDFAWWSGLTIADAKRGVAGAGAHLAQQTLDGFTCWSVPSKPPRPLPKPWARLLPNYDEILIAYRDREPLQRSGFARRDRYQHHLMIDGRIAGSWRTLPSPESRVVFHTYESLTTPQTRALDGALARYQRFVG